MPRAKWLHIAFALCVALVCALAPLRAAPTLTLSTPVYSSCRTVTIGGAVTPPGVADTVVKISWNWGDGSASDSLFPATHKYLGDGTFTVWATVQSTSSGYFWTSTQVVINSSGTLLAPGTLKLAAPVYGACGLVTIGGVQEGDAIAQVKWNWGDGSTSALFLPATHKYSRDGTFSVQATARTVAGDSGTASTRAVIGSSGDAACALTAPYYTTSTVAGVDFAAGKTAKATALCLRGDGSNLAVDTQDNLYISDRRLGRVWRITPAGTASLVAGSGMFSWIAPQGVFSATSSPVYAPVGVTVSKAGVRYVLEYDPINLTSIPPGSTR